MIYFFVLLSLFMEYFRPEGYFPVIGTLKLNVIIPIATFLASLCSHKDSISNKSIFMSVNSKLLVFFIGLLALSTLTSVVRLYAFTKLKAVLGYIFLYFVLNKEIDTRIKLNLFIVNLVVIHLLLIMLNPEVVLNPETRSYIKSVTFLGDGNDFALSLCILLPWCIYLFTVADHKTMKLLALGIGGILFMAVIGTQSRGASIGLVFIMLFQWIKSQKKIFGLVIIALIILGTLMFASQNYLDRMESISKYETEGSAVGRIMAWESAIRMALDNPILGQGAGHFAVKYGTEFRPPGFGRTDLPWQTAHSSYFLALGELGIPGLFFIIFILGYNFHQNNRLIRAADELTHKDNIRSRILLIALNSSIIGFAVPGAFLSALYYPHIFVIAGLCEAVRRLHVKEVKVMAV